MKITKTVEIYVCDCCKNELKIGKENHIQFYKDNNVFTAKIMDVCDDCYESILSLFDMKKPEENSTATAEKTEAIELPAGKHIKYTEDMMKRIKSYYVNGCDIKYICKKTGLDAKRIRYAINKLKKEGVTVKDVLSDVDLSNKNDGSKHRWNKTTVDTRDYLVVNE